MVNIVAKKMAFELIKRVRKVKYDVEVYVYGFELVISTIVCWVAILINAFLLSDLMSGIVFIITFSSLRIFAGGYHAESYSKCFVVSNLLFVLLFLMKKVTQNFGTLVWCGLLIVAGIYIFVNAPIVNPEQPICEAKQILCKKNIRYVLGIDSLCILVVLLVNKEIMSMAVLSICSVAFLMLISDKHIYKIKEV